MTADQLADYLINHDWEISIIKREYEYIQEAMRDGEMPMADFDTIMDALEIANDDPYIIGVAKLYEGN